MHDRITTNPKNTTDSTNSVTLRSNANDTIFKFTPYELIRQMINKQGLRNNSEKKFLNITPPPPLHNPGHVFKMINLLNILWQPL